MDEYLLKKEEEWLCKKYGAADLKVVLGIQYDILRQYYSLRDHHPKEVR